MKKNKNKTDYLKFYISEDEGKKLENPYENESEYDELKKDLEYAKKFKDYNFNIHWLDSKKYDIYNDVVDVMLNTSDETYVSSFITRDRLNYLFDKNKRTDECQNGIYFTMPNMVVVENLKQKTIKKVIDDMVNDFCVEDYFEKL